MNCPQCSGYGLTGTLNILVCSECLGVGTISVDDTSSLATLNGASLTAIEVTSPRIASTKVVEARMRATDTVIL